MLKPPSRLLASLRNPYLYHHVHYSIAAPPHSTPVSQTPRKFFFLPSSANLRTSL
ncbi:hypothetical protein M407DRAFT_246558, partial [Tulasnella calospora MUT 4182]